MKNIQKELFKMQDKKYRDMQIKIIPTINPDEIIGVRTPELRDYAKELIKENYLSFLNELPHRYFDENQLHAFIISQIKDYDECISLVNDFLPYIDNWATCDQMSPKVFKKHLDELLKQIKVWIKSKKVYTIRFGISMLMQYFLDDNFKKEYLEMVSNIKSEEYYVNMMRAWFFATALAKQYDSTLPFIEKHKLDLWTHNKTIQKAAESYRISEKQKDYLKSLKIKSA
ncbi:MAG: DNA alkylation repair protein [Bacilli bacterium]|nr:DNA alkylation repair protein [Bacilli bacterium]